MQKKGGNISLSSYDDIFSTEESRTEATQERVQEIPLSELHPFEGHPFKVVDDEAMMKTVESTLPYFLCFGGIKLLAGTLLLLWQNPLICQKGEVMGAKLEKLGAELQKARKKKAEWDAKVKDLERRYREEENSEIHEMVHAANLTPDQLSELLRLFAEDAAPNPATIQSINEEETAHEV